jgi:hypothetical protein
MDRIVKVKLKTRNTERVVKLGRVKKVGTQDLESFSKNFKEINKRIQSSRDAGFHIESISLRLQLVDMRLRLLLNKKTGREFAFDGRYDFGAIIRESQRFLPPELYDKLNEFNKNRKKAIHKFIYGGTSYEEIEKTSNDYKFLHAEVLKFIVKEFQSDNSIDL